MGDRHIIRNRRIELSRCDWTHWGIVIQSGAEERRPHLMIAAFSLWAFIYLPGWVLAPHRHKVVAETWDAATVMRMGRNWYWDETRREYGLQWWGDNIRFYYGVQPDCWPGDKNWAWYFPWCKLRYMGQRWYDLQGNLCAALAEAQEVAARADGKWSHEVREQMEAGVPKAMFEVEDFDGTRIRATTHISEREWHHGDGWFKWLAWFIPAIVSRSLSIEFSGEVGYEKGSWKGGLIGCSIKLNPGELHESAMRRFCEQGVSRKGRTAPLKFIGAAA